MPVQSMSESDLEKYKELFSSLVKGDSSSRLATLKDIFASLSPQTGDPRIKALKEEHLKNLEKEELDFMISILSKQTEDTSRRQLAANMLGFTKSDYGIDALLEAWKDKDMFVAMAAGIAMGNLGTKRAVEPFIKTYQSQSKEFFNVRKMTAVDNLGRLSDPRALPVLEEAMNDQDGNIRELAVAAFENLYLAYLTGKIPKKDLSADTEIALDTVRLYTIYRVHPEGFQREQQDTMVEEICRIGMRLNREGGKDLMLKAHASFTQKCKIAGAARNLEIMWDGIGEWRG